MAQENQNRTVGVRRPLQPHQGQARPPRPRHQAPIPPRPLRHKPTGRRPLSTSFLHLEPKLPVVVAEADDGQACENSQVSFFFASSAEPSPTASAMALRNVNPALAATPVTSPRSTSCGAGASAGISHKTGIRSRTSSNSSSAGGNDNTVSRDTSNGGNHRHNHHNDNHHHHQLPPTLPPRRRPSRRLRILRNLLPVDGGGDAEDGTCRQACASGRRHRNPDNLLRLDGCLWPADRPSSLRDQPPRCIGNGDGPRFTRACSDGQVSAIDSPPPSAIMTRDDFDALPPTIQRKYFSTLERLRIARNSHFLNGFDEATNPSHQRSLSLPLCELELPRQRRRSELSFDDLGSLLQSRSTNNLIVADSTKRLSGRRHQSNEELSCYRRRESVILDATDEAYLRLGRQQWKGRGPTGQSPYLRAAAAMQRAAEDKASSAGGLDTTTDSFYECFRWLEDDDTLDLRLHLDDYHFNLREQGVDSSKSHGQRPSFRRHLSISKLPFGGRTSETSSPPESKDESPTPVATPIIGSNGHARRRSRALSLISPKQSLPDLSAVMDPGACHYQDPDARMKLRVYLGSPHKFDEAVEFGFPSMDLSSDQESKKHARTDSETDSPRLHTFLEDDVSSMYSETSAGEPESPRTPETSEHPLPLRPIRVSQERAIMVKGDYAQAPATSREMTLRMTLTRPDLRSHEGEMYGWQKRAMGRKSSELLSPVMLNTKESIERQFAAIDEEELANGSGVVKRFWNRVRRT